jgi:hypothetical protein
MLSFIGDPGHWRQRAEEMRTLAERVRDPQTKATMRRIAQDFERLAKWADARLGGEDRSRQWH